jgi:hypothetical protein
MCVLLHAFLCKRAGAGHDLMAVQDVAMAQVKEQYQYFLDQRKKAFDDVRPRDSCRCEIEPRLTCCRNTQLQAEYSTYKARTESERTGMQSDFGVLLDYTHKLATIVENMERGCVSL